MIADGHLAPANLHDLMLEVDILDAGLALRRDGSLSFHISTWEDPNSRRLASNGPVVARAAARKALAGY